MPTVALVVGMALSPQAGAAAAPARTPRGPQGADVRQMLLVTSAGWDETQGNGLRYERAEGGPWRPVGDAFPVSLGRTGLAWGRGLHGQGKPVGARQGGVKQEGDGRAPAGVFALRGLTGYADKAPAGAKLSYQQATETLRCVDDPASAAYNTLAPESAGQDWSSAEEMRRKDELYRFVVWVGHNDAPAQPGGGSCIFLHLRDKPDATTAGCTAFDPGPMAVLLRWLDPAAQPVLIQVPRNETGALAGWNLPHR